MCMASNKPLIESGTNGYNGNVTPIIKGQTQCYDCVPRVEGKTYPICTIRSTPSKMVHCVVWAKALYEVLFSEYDDFNYLNDLRGAGIETTEAGAAEKWGKKLFYEDIVELNKMREEKCRPLLDESEIKEYAATFCTSYEKLKGKIAPFDKDNKDALGFVYASANLRAMNFSIPVESQFKIKEIAGNIIAAISSTNAMVASMQVLEAIKIIENPNTPAIRDIFVSNMQTRLVSSVSAIGSPSANCWVCSKQQKVIKLQADLTNLTLGTFIEKFVKAELGIAEPLIEYGSNMVYESGEGLDVEEVKMYEKRLKESMSSNGIGEEVFTVEDYVQDVKAKVQLEDTKLDPNEFPFFYKSIENAGSYTVTEAVKRPVIYECKSSMKRLRRMSKCV
eukprot:TRINITY_DN13501_c0_g2_i1.p1 TRINITY_DN13501_c0_g2~~TRINITY_DN13501_c0_g2_i1.p1  ORF type:complete len:391 (-),score=110.62 TRINITY_DN13501_c0_g2_i1:202-1374(-)